MSIWFWLNMCLSSTNKDVVATLQLFHVLLIVPHQQGFFFFLLTSLPVPLKSLSGISHHKQQHLPSFVNKKRLFTVFCTHAILLLTALLMTVGDVVLLHENINKWVTAWKTTVFHPPPRIRTLYNNCIISNGTSTMDIFWITGFQST